MTILISDPLADSKQKIIHKDQTITKTYRYPTKNCKVLTQWVFVALGPKLTYKNCNLKILRKILEDNQYIDEKSTITKTGTLTATFHKPAWEENLYVGFGYVSLIICRHIGLKVSG